MTLTNYYYLNEIGNKKKQEDFIWPAPGFVSAASKIFIVCDGVGGSSRGEVASRIVAEHMGNSLSKMDTSSLSIEKINALLIQARTLLSEYAKVQSTGSDMATTFTLVLFNMDKAFIAWCGDSRVYHFRGGVIIYKTDDHSLVNSLVKSGEISEKDASVHPQRNIILKAIKADSAVVEAEGGWTSAIEDGDYFLLCTDGLLENWNDEELSALFVKNNTAKIDLGETIKKKSFNRTRDNYSMHLLQVGIGEQKSPAKKSIIAGLLFIVIVLTAVIAGVIYVTNQKKSGPAASETTVSKTDSIEKVNTQAVDVRADTLMIKSNEAELKNSTDAPAPVRSEIINPPEEKHSKKSMKDPVSKK